MESVEELRELLETNLPAENLLNEIEYYFGSWKMRECYRDICRSWDIEFESEE